MQGITIYLEAAEQAAVRRHAEAIGVECEDIAYAALNRLMAELKTHPQEIDQQIVGLRDSHSRRPLLWGDSPRMLHPFGSAEKESMFGHRLL